MKGLRVSVLLSLLAMAACRPSTSTWYQFFDVSPQPDAPEEDATQPDGATMVAKVVGVAVGGGHICARTESGRLYCWGNNNNGQTAEDSSLQTPAPTWVSQVNDARLVAASVAHTCSTDQSGKVQCWGNNTQGELGMNTGLARQSVPVTVNINGTDEDRALGVGNGFSCVRDMTSNVHCWGSSANGHLGYTGISDPAVTLTFDNMAAAAAPATRLAVGGEHACAEVELTGAAFGVYCWGSRSAGQSGNGMSPMPYERPTFVDLSMETDRQRMVDLVAGATHTCFVSGGGPNAGKAFCFGANGFGQLGNGTTNDSIMPVNVLNASNLIRLASGDNHACALSGPAGSGTIWCWGSNDFRQAGSESPSVISTPQAVNIQADGRELRASDIAAGGNSTCAIAEGRLFCWGSAMYGQFVNTGTTERPTEIVIRE